MMRTFGVSLVAGWCASLIFAATLVGQQENVQQEVEVQELAVVEGQALAIGPMGMNPGRLLGAKQFQLNQVFALEIKRIDAVCKLAESQKAKLQVGAKGAVKKLVEEFRQEQVENPVLGLVMNDGDNSGEGEENKAVEIEEIKDIDSVDNYVWQMIDMGNGADELFTVKRPTENVIWLKTVQSTLNAEQQQAFQAFQEQERAAQSQAMLDLGVKQFTIQLALNEQQAQAFRGLVEKQFSKFERVPAIYASFQFLFAASSVAPEDMKKILEENQYNYFLILTAPMKDMVMAIDAAAENAQEIDDEDDDE